MNEWFRQLSNLPGIPGHEKKVAAYIKKVVTPMVDYVDQDQLGSVIATKKGTSDVTIMLSAHMDEVGFLISSIEASGMVRMQPVGGWWGHVMLAQVFLITTRSGKTIEGIVGSKPPHGMPAEVRNRVIDIKDMFLDIGCASKEEVLALGIQIGDMVTPKMEARRLNNSKLLLGKAWDDRVCCGVQLEVLKRLEKKTIVPNVVAAFTVQEEIGLRGAKTSSYKIQPDIALALDVTMSNDMPGVPKADTALGKGVALSLMDATVIAHRGLLDAVEKVAIQEKIQYTYDMMVVGGTDAGEIHKQRDGVITMTLSLPCRYFHSHTSLVHEDDIEAMVQLIVAYIDQFKPEHVAQLAASKFED